MTTFAERKLRVVHAAAIFPHLELVLRISHRATSGHQLVDELLPEIFRYLRIGSPPAPAVNNDEGALRRQNDGDGVSALLVRSSVHHNGHHPGKMPTMPGLVRNVAILTLLLAGCSGSTSSTEAAQRDSPSLVGTWRAIRYQTWNEQGRISTPFGDPVSGYAVFDGTGHAFVQLMRVPAVQPFQSPAAPTEQEVRDAFAAFAAYYGSYTIDDASHTVTIRVEGSNLPSYIGSRQVRSFQIRNDTLTLGIAGQYQATLVRVK